MSQANTRDHYTFCIQDYWSDHDFPIYRVIVCHIPRLIVELKIIKKFVICYITIITNKAYQSVLRHRKTVCDFLDLLDWFEDLVLTRD